MLVFWRVSEFQKGYYLSLPGNAEHHREFQATQQMNPLEKKSINLDLPWKKMLGFPSDPKKNEQYPKTRWWKDGDESES